MINIKPNIEPIQIVLFLEANKRNKENIKNDAENHLDLNTTLKSNLRSKANNRDSITAFANQPVSPNVPRKVVLKSPLGIKNGIG